MLSISDVCLRVKFEFDFTAIIIPWLSLIKSLKSCIFCGQNKQRSTWHFFAKLANEVNCVVINNNNMTKQQYNTCMRINTLVLKYILYRTYVPIEIQRLLIFVCKQNVAKDFKCYIHIIIVLNIKTNHFQYYFSWKQVCTNKLWT